MKTIDTEDAIEASEADYLYTADSQIPNAGKGLYTCISIFKDEVITLFAGEKLSNAEAELRAKNNVDQYFINMLDGSIMDSKNTDCFAKYANDAQAFGANVFKNNAKIAVDANDNVCLIALKKINAGEEIFCSYGKNYWKAKLK